jgi:hypothetical protein
MKSAEDMQQKMKQHMMQNGLRTARALTPPIRNRSAAPHAVALEQVIWPNEKVAVAAKAHSSFTGDNLVIESGSGLVIHDVLVRGVSGRPHAGKPLQLDIKEGDEVALVVENSSEDMVPKVFKARIEGK